MANIYWLYHSHQLENLWSLFHLSILITSSFFRPFFMEVLPVGWFLRFWNYVSIRLLGRIWEVRIKIFLITLLLNEIFGVFSLWSLWSLLTFILLPRFSSVQSFGDFFLFWCFFFTSYLFKLSEVLEKMFAYGISLQALLRMFYGKCHMN